MKRKKMIGLLLVGSLLLVGCSSKKPEDKTSGKKEDKQTISVASASELSTGDVSLAMDNTAVQAVSQFGEGLYAFDGNGKAVPALAKEVVEPTNNGLTYEFELREANWSNGKKITAQDFEYSWKRTVDKKTASPQAYYFSGIKNYQKIADGELEADKLGIKAVDDKTIEVTLEYPMSYFLELLAVPAFYPLNQEYVE
ncbi:MAG: ABC transporter substrate-binding protein, partial [Vagococcus sp.]